jgi:hypothetical protein
LDAIGEAFPHERLSAPQGRSSILPGKIEVTMRILGVLCSAIVFCSIGCTQAVDDASDMAEANASVNDESSVGEAAEALTGTINGCSGTISPLFRYWSASGSDHFYTTTWAELGWGGSGYVIEGTAGSLLASSFAPCGATPLYRYYSGAASDHFYTTNWSELGGGSSGYTYEGVQGYCFPSPVTGTVPLYRYYSGSSPDHFYTTNWSELGAGAAGYVLEGIQCYVSPYSPSL